MLALISGALPTRPRGTISLALPRAGIVGVPAHSTSGMRAVALVGSLPRVAASACALLLVDCPSQQVAERNERSPVSQLERNLASRCQPGYCCRLSTRRSIATHTS
jgi:hypothetical protein